MSTICLFAFTVFGTPTLKERFGTTESGTRMTETVDGYAFNTPRYSKTGPSVNLPSKDNLKGSDAREGCWAVVLIQIDQSRRKWQVEGVYCDMPLGTGCLVRNLQRT